MPDSLERTVVLAGPVPPGATAWDDFLAAGGGRRPDRDRGAGCGPRPRRRQHHHLHLGHHREAQGGDAAPRGSVRAFSDWCGVVGLQQGDRYLIVNPFFHTFGLNAGILACLITGATIVPHPVFDVPSVMRRVDEERITMLPGAPAIYQTILDHPDLADYDLSTLRLAVTGRPRCRSR